jgi:hypothetical protein
MRAGQANLPSRSRGGRTSPFQTSPAVAARGLQRLAERTGALWMGLGMAQNARPTAAKREREKALAERRKFKEARRRDSKERKLSTEAHPDGVDPDIAHIKLGPQPLADWQVEEEET